MNDIEKGNLVEVTPQQLDTFDTFVGKVLSIYVEEDGQVPIITITVQNVNDGKIFNVDDSQCKLFEVSL